MDCAADSDTENSLPVVSICDIDAASLRQTLLFLPDEIRLRLRSEALNSRFALLFEPPDTTEASDFHEHHEIHEIAEELGANIAEVPEEALTQPPGTSTTDLHHINVVSSPTQTPIDVVTQPAEETGFRRPRSLRKRTFASRHPYIADQADWLGICTVDSINEMFDGDEDITRVVRALNQLYLQKKKRYPDEDRYRSKDFYTHLGHSKTLAIQGDSELVDLDDINGSLAENNAQADSQEHNYDPYSHSSQINPSGEEEEGEEEEDDDDVLIPYEDFEIPYSQNPTNTSDTGASSYIENGYNYSEADQREMAEVAEVSDASSYSSADEAEEEEQYIKVGGRYRKISTILRGVLPESAKRLGIFEQKSSTKRRKPVVRSLTPRRGLAMKKTRASGSNSADLHKELYASINQDEEVDLAPKQISPLSHFERVKYDRPMPDLSRASTSFSYISDTPEPHYVDSGSDSEVEIYTLNNDALNHPQSFSTVTTNIQPLGATYQPIEVDDIEEYDEIDHLLASRGPLPRKTTRKKNSSDSKRTRNSEKRPYSRPRQRRLNAPKVSIGRPAATRHKVSKPRGKNYHRRPKVLDKLQTKLPAFRKSLYGETPMQVFDDDDYSAENQTITAKKPTKPKSKSKSNSKPKKESAQGLPKNPIQQHFKRGPVISTSAIEIESVNKSVGHSSVVSNSVIQRFDPTRQSLLGSVSSTSSSSLTGLEDTSSVRGLRDGRVFFANEDTITIMFLGKSFVFALFNREESSKNALALLASFHRLVTNPKLLLKPEVNANAHLALRSLIKWLLMCRERPSGSVWSHMRSILDEFAKLQMKGVRVLQTPILGQLLFIFWILIQLEHRHKSDQEVKLMEYLSGYCSDFFVIFFSSFTASDLSSAYMKDSPTHELYQSVMLIFTVFEKEEKCWWPAMVQAVEEMVLFGNQITDLLDLIYLLGAIIPKKYHSWTPFLVLLNKLKTAVESLGHRHFIENCELAHQRLDWSYDERVLTQLYGLFGARKFANFVDETNVPSSVGIIHSRADIPTGSVFEKFLGLLYIYISELSSAKEVKKLLSKLLASSQYHYVRGRKSQIMFANRLNLIVLLSQVSDVNLSSQFTNLIVQIRDSADPFVFGRSLDALQVFCETSANRNRPLPMNAFMGLFKCLSEMTIQKAVSPSLFQKLIDLMGQTFRGISSENNEGVFGLLKILTSSDISKIPESSVLELLGTVLLSIMEVEIFETELNGLQIAIFGDFQKSLLKLLSVQMERLPASKPNEDQAIEEIVELAIQIWMLSNKVTKSQHWNNMMYQKYSYLGNSMARNRFIMFLCLEFIQYSTVDSFVLQEIERIFLNGLVSPNLSKYSVDLYRSLSENLESVFFSRDTQIPQMTSLTLLQTYRLRIITRALENIVNSSKLHGNEKSTMISSFVKRVHDVYTEQNSEKGVTEMCKRITETVQRVAKNLIANHDEFWELSTKLGFPNKNVQYKWSNADGQGKVQLLNTEFISALAYGKSHIVALDNWKTQENDLVLFTLLQVYVSALNVSGAYWAHICLLLEYILIKLEKFEISTNAQIFKDLLSLLKELSLLSNYRNDTRYSLHEIKALKTCVSILKLSFVVFDGYKDKQDVHHLILEFLANKDIESPKRYKVSTVFMELSIEALQSGSHVSYHPKYQHTTQEFEEACSGLKAAFQDLTLTVSGTVHEDLMTKGIEDYAFF